MNFLEILYWLLVILSAVGIVMPPQPWIGRFSAGVLLVLFCILGYWHTGNPIHR